MGSRAWQAGVLLLLSLAARPARAADWERFYRIVQIGEIIIPDLGSSTRSGSPVRAAQLEANGTADRSSAFAGGASRFLSGGAARSAPCSPRFEAADTRHSASVARRVLGRFFR